MGPPKLVHSADHPAPVIERPERWTHWATVDAVVLEDDTFGVLASDPGVRDPGAHPIRIMEGLYRPGRQPGTLVIATGRPPRWLAVVHDLDEDPSWQTDWIIRVMGATLEQCRRRGVAHLAMEPLGCVHGRLSATDFNAVLTDALDRDRPPGLRRVTVLPPHWRRTTATR